MFHLRNYSTKFDETWYFERTLKVYPWGQEVRVGPRASVESLAKKNIPPPGVNQTPVVQPNSVGDKRTEIFETIY
jgi:hypothetical protein